MLRLRAEIKRGGLSSAGAVICLGAFFLGSGPTQAEEALQGATTNPNPRILLRQYEIAELREMLTDGQESRIPWALAAELWQRAPRRVARLLERERASDGEDLDSTDSQPSHRSTKAAYFQPAPIDVNHAKVVYETTLADEHTETWASLRAADDRSSTAYLAYYYTETNNLFSFNSRRAVHAERTGEATASLAYTRFNSVFGTTTYGVYGVATNPDAGNNYGVYGSSNQANGYGVYASNNTAEDTKGHALYARSRHNTSSVSPANHTAVIENAASDNPKILSLYMSNVSDTALGLADNFITFNADNGNGNPTAVGAIEGTYSGVTLDTSSGDFAEWLPRAQADEPIDPGDIVGIRAGEVSKKLQGAHRISVVSTSPAVSGNSPGEGEKSGHERIAFIGQVPVRVTGPVEAGDYILPSGRDDGTGIARPADAIPPAQMDRVVGQAWESNPGAGEKQVTVAVGLPPVQAYDALQAQAERIDQLEAELAQRDEKLDRLMQQVGALADQVADGAARSRKARHAY